MKRIMLALLCLFLSMPAWGQFITVTASHLTDSSGNLVTNASITFAPVLLNGTPTSYRKLSGGGGQAVATPVAATVTNGAFSISVADPTSSSPLNFCYSVSLIDNNTGSNLLGAGYSCVQPSATANWCSTFPGGYSCSFDSYTPNLLPVAMQQVGPTGAQGIAGPAGPPGGSLSYPGVTSDGAGGLSKSNTVFNVKGYGATGNGTTDDSSAITAAIAAITTAGGGRLYFPVGTYYSANCGFTISAPTIVQGDGVTDRASTTFGSTVNCGSPTAVLFNVTAAAGSFQDITLWNTASTTPTSGSAILTNSTYPHQRIDYHNIVVSGFYDDVVVNVGEAWSMTGCILYNPVRYGISIANNLVTDAGDWHVTGNWFIAGLRTNDIGSAGLYQTSSGGGVTSFNKWNSLAAAGSTGYWTHAILLNLAGSEQSQFIGNNIDVITYKEPIYIQQGWPWMSFTDNLIISMNGYSGIYAATGLNNVYIGGGTIVSTGNAPYAINLAGSGQSLQIMPFGTNKATWTTALTNVTSDASVGNVNNTNLDANAFNGTSVTASGPIQGFTGLFGSGIAVGSPTTGGQVAWDGNTTVSGQNWACTTVGGPGLSCSNTTGAGLQLLDNNTVNAIHGPYAVGGVSGVTKTCTVLPTVVGGIITGC